MSAVKGNVLRLLNQIVLEYSKLMVHHSQS